MLCKQRVGVGLFVAWSVFFVAAPRDSAGLIRAATQTTGSPPGEELSPDELFVLLADALDAYESIRLQFRGSVSLGSKPEPDSAMFGTWWWRKDGYQRLDFETRYGPQPDTGNRMLHENLVKAPDRITELSHPRDGFKTAAIHPGRHIWKGSFPGMPERLFLLPSFASFEGPMRQTIRVHGWEAAANRRCLKVSFCPIPVAGVAPEKLLRWTYWIDVERGMHVLRAEFKRGSQMRRHLHSVELRRIDEDVWFPVKGQIDGYATDSGWSPRPTSMEQIEFTPDTIAANIDVPDNVFAVDLEQGTRVNDHLSGKHYFEGAPPLGVTHAPPTQEQIDTLLQEADSERATIEASSLARTPFRNWPYWTVGVISLALMIVGAFCILFRRRA